MPVEYLSESAVGAVMRVLFYSTAAGFVATRLEPVSCPDGAGCSSEFRDFIGPRELTADAQTAALRPWPAWPAWPAGAVRRVINSRSQASASRTMVERSS